jgi:hypothetical protein
MMDLRETTWSRGSHRLRGRHRHHLLAHLFRNNHTTIRVNGAPEALERNLSATIRQKLSSAIFCQKLSSAIFQVSATTEEEMKTISKEKGRGKDR